MPAPTPPPHARPGAAVDPDATLEAESVFARFRESLPETKFRDVAIHDDKGELLWRDRPDSNVEFEQVLREAFDALGLGIRYPYLEFPLDERHTTVVLPAWAPNGALAAVASLVLESAPLDRQCAKFVTPPVRGALKAIGSSLSGLEWPPETPEPQSAATPEWRPPVDDLATSELEPAVTAKPATQSPAPSKKPTPAPAANDPEIERIVAAIRDQNLELHVQPLARLRSSARTRRYEVLLRSRAEGDAVAPQALLRGAREHGLDSMLDRRVISQLIAWLVRHREMWKGDIPMFSVNLSVMAISEAHFFKFVDLCVRKAGLPKGLIGFEITEKACRDKPECALRAIETFRGLGCPVVIDDFSMHSDVLPLLTQPGIRLVKLDPQLTIGALGDRLREARVVSLVQAMRVLGMQTVAKRVEDEAEREWLTALGVDFVQSFRFCPPEPLEEWGRKKA